MKKYVYKSRLLKGIIFIIDAVGYLLKWTLSIFKKRNARQIERILIIKLDHAGDVLLSTPAIKYIRKNFPLSHITLVVGPWAKGIIEREEYIDEIICYKAYWQDRSLERSLNISGLFKLIRTLRQARYDIFFDLKGDLFAIVIGFLSGIPRRIGYGWSGCGFLLTDEVETAVNKHQAEILLDAVRTIGIETDVPKIDITISEGDKKYADALLKKEGWNESLLTIGFHVGSGCASKMWAVERYAALMEMVVSRLNAQVIIVGGTDDIEITKKLESLLSFRPINMAGRMTFKQTAAAIKRCSLFIGNDSVPVHIAAAVEVPVVVLFSAANDCQRWKPYGYNVAVICKDVPCYRCEKAVCDSMECMNLITVDEVFDLVLDKSKAQEI